MRSFRAGLDDLAVRQACARLERGDFDLRENEDPGWLPVPAPGMSFDSVARVGPLTANSKLAAVEARSSSIIFLNAVN